MMDINEIKFIRIDILIFLRINIYKYSIHRSEVSLVSLPLVFSLVMSNFKSLFLFSSRYFLLRKFIFWEFFFLLLFLVLIVLLDR